MSSIDLATLRHLYVDEQLSIRDIAAILCVNPRTVHNALIRNRIPRRQCWAQHAAIVAGRVTREELNEANLRHLYMIEGYSIREIATILDICPSTVQHALIRCEIPRRRRGRPGKQSAY